VPAEETLAEHLLTVVHGGRKIFAGGSASSFAADCCCLEVPLAARPWSLWCCHQSATLFTMSSRRPRVQVLLLSLLDMPFSISPVVTGLMLTLLYGR
jgi:ABC-type molybdate transport system permease subunit